MNLDQLETFVSVADCGSFTQAAAELYVTPSALMQRIRNLEREIGFDLFGRTPRSARFDGSHPIERVAQAHPRRGG